MNYQWPEKTCDNCGNGSYTLAIKDLCPYCDKTLFVEKIINKKTFKKMSVDQMIKYIKGELNDDYLSKQVKKYKIKITDEELKNIVLMILVSR